jgi:hypothetical protein
MDEFFGSQISDIGLTFFMCPNTFTQSIVSRDFLERDLRLESPSSTSAVLRRRFVALASGIGVISSISSAEGTSRIRGWYVWRVLGCAVPGLDCCLSFLTGRILTLVQTRYSGPLNISSDP